MSDPTPMIPPDLDEDLAFGERLGKMTEAQLDAEEQRLRDRLDRSLLSEAMDE
ncbi:MAG: hypothetical protein JW820_10700 [Spirochaetales bacterium]|nr:hypothetical protein [Spirochaetales bacterium]